MEAAKPLYNTIHEMLSEKYGEEGKALAQALARGVKAENRITRRKGGMYPECWRQGLRRKWTQGAVRLTVEYMTYILANPHEMLWDNDMKKPVSAAFVTNYQARFLYNQLGRGRYYFACPIKPTIEANNEEVKG